MAQVKQVQATLRRVPQAVWFVLLLIGGVLLPLPLNSYLRAVLWQTGIYILLGLSLNIIVGYTGQFQLGHAAYYALGAYTVGILNVTFHVPVVVGMVLAVFVAGLAGFVITRPILHLRGDYLAIVTIAFGEIVRMLLVNNIGGVTGGSNGISGIAQPVLFGYTLKTTLGHYYLVLFFVVLTIVAMRRLENSRLGRAWTYVREDEMAAEAMGVDVVRVKATAFLLGSAWAGMIILPELFRVVRDWRDGFIGLAMVLMMIFRPMGLWPSRRVAVEMAEDQDQATPVKAALT